MIPVHLMPGSGQTHVTAPLDGCRSLGRIRIGERAARTRVRLQKQRGTADCTEN